MTFKLNMTKEVEEAKDFEFPPSGDYICYVTGIELKEVQTPGDNFGKPYWKVTLTVDEGTYAGRTIPTNINLYESEKNKWSLLALKQLCIAVHPEFIEGGQINLPSIEGQPSPDPWLGQKVHISGTKFAKGTKRKNGDLREYDEFQIKYKSLKDSKKPATDLPLPA